MPSTKSPIAKLLADLREALSSLNVRWYVFGAQAAIVYGANRLTADVDVTLDLGDKTTTEVIKALSKKGFRPQIPDRSFIEMTRVIPVVHIRSAMPLDLVLAGPGLEEEFFKRVVNIAIGARKFPFAAAEDLIAMKILSSRPKDLDDVESILLARWDALDRALIRKTLKTAELMLDQSDLLTAFDALARRTSKAISGSTGGLSRNRQPRPNQKRRR